MTVLRISGQSEVESAVAINGKGVHDVTLAWEGFLEVSRERLHRLVLSARGKEKLQFAKDDHPLKKVQRDEVAFLPGGRPIDVDCAVRYGVLGEAAARGEAEADARAGDGDGAPPGEFPDEARKQLVEVLGGKFIIFRDRVQGDLKLSDEQKRKLLEEFPAHVQATMSVFDRIKNLKPEEGEKEMQQHRRRSDEKLSAFLKDVLDAGQHHRLFQVQLRQAGVFALLGENETFLPLKISEKQRDKFRGVVREMEQEIQAFIKEAQDGAKPEDIRARVLKIRKAHEAKIDALLSEAQRKQWEGLLGKPLDLEN